MHPVVSWYDANAARLAGPYEAVPPVTTAPWLADLLSPKPAVVLDVRAGTGRDAAAFAALGHEVVAVEPSAGCTPHRASVGWPTRCPRSRPPPGPGSPPIWC